MSKKAVSNNLIGRIFANRLKELMEIHPNLDTQVKVAKASGMSQTAIGRILRGQVSPSLDHVSKIVTAFDSTIGGVIEQPISPTALTYDKERFARLPEHERERIESMIAYEIKNYEARNPLPKKNLLTNEGYKGIERRMERAPYKGEDRRKSQ